MITRLPLLPLTVGLLLGGWSPGHPAEPRERPADGLSGTWSGTLQVGPQELPLVFAFAAAPGGHFTGTLTSLAQSPRPIPFTTIRLRGRDLRASVDAIGGVFTGKIASGGTAIRGEWSQGGLSLLLDLAFLPDGAPAGPARPQTPRPPLPYVSETVSFPNPAGGHHLSGTLTRPKEGGAPVPAVVLISGSGPQDRDETLFGHKPFAVLADHLSREGIAVLRCDDRGTGASGGVFEHATTLDFAADAGAALAFLRTRKEIDPVRIGLIGHSEGGLIAPMVAAERPGEVAFLVLLAAPGLRGDETLLSQNRALLTAAGLEPELVDLVEALSRSLFAALTQPDPDPAKVQALAETFQAEWKKLSPEDARALGEIGPGLEKQIQILQTPWFARSLVLDPADSLRRITVPVLALNGSLDLQVLPGPHLAAIRRSLAEAENRSVAAEVLPGLNHLFQPARTGLPSEYWRLETTFEPSVLRRISDWIRETATAP